MAWKFGTIPSSLAVVSFIYDSDGRSYPVRMQPVRWAERVGPEATPATWSAISSAK